MANGTPDYTVKELLAGFVIPRLENIERLLGSKAEDRDLRDLAARVKILEDETLHPAAVKDLVKTVLQDSEARGWTKRERTLAILVATVSIAGFAVQAYAQFGG